MADYSDTEDCMYIIMHKLCPISGYMVFPSNPWSGGQQNHLVQLGTKLFSDLSVPVTNILQLKFEG